MLFVYSGARLPGAACCTFCLSCAAWDAHEWSGEMTKSAKLNQGSKKGGLTVEICGGASWDQLTG